MIDHLICPLCSNEFTLEGKSVKCRQGHCFDFAKEGYLNLLPVHRKNSKDPGDSKEMMQARRSFLEGGHYAPLVNHIKETIETHCPNPKSMLDLGCGEGYYTDQLFSDTQNVLGFDIAKNAIRAASKKYSNALFFVGSIYNIPIKPLSIDLAMSIFTPLDSKQIANILSEQGVFMVVSSGANHMKEIAEFIYEKFKPHEYAPIDKLSEDFDLMSSEDCSFTVKVENSQDAMNMVKMTPYFWSMTQRSNDMETIPLEVTAHFKISIFSKKDYLV